LAATVAAGSETICGWAWGRFWEAFLPTDRVALAAVARPLVNAFEAIRPASRANETTRDPTDFRDAETDTAGFLADLALGDLVEDFVSIVGMIKSGLADFCLITVYLDTPRQTFVQLNSIPAKNPHIPLIFNILPPE
jgi:hypothetical protein